MDLTKLARPLGWFSIALGAIELIAPRRLAAAHGKAEAAPVVGAFGVREIAAGIGIPVVLLERTATAGPHHAVLESVVTDHALGAAMAVRHLASLGHRKVGLVLAENSPTGPHVRRGWLSAVRECELDTATVDARVPDARHPECKAALDRVLDDVSASGTTALLVHADAEAIALVQRCEERHLTIPGDLSVVAYDDEVAGNLGQLQRAGGSENRLFVEFDLDARNAAGHRASGNDDILRVQHRLGAFCAGDLHLADGRN